MTPEEEREATQALVDARVVAFKQGGNALDALEQKLINAGFYASRFDGVLNPEEKYRIGFEVVKQHNAGIPAVAHGPVVEGPSAEEIQADVDEEIHRRFKREQAAVFGYGNPEDKGLFTDPLGHKRDRDPEPEDDPDEDFKKKQARVWGY